MFCLFILFLTQITLRPVEIHANNLVYYVSHQVLTTIDVNATNSNNNKEINLNQ